MKSVNKYSLLLALGMLLAGVGIGKIFLAPKEESQVHEGHGNESKTQEWTCSMHPQIRQKEPGKCPLCGMDLIPVTEESGEENPMALKMSPTAMQLAQVRTQIVKEGLPTKRTSLNGKVKEDERAVYTQTAHIGGRVEKLLVNYSGEYVKKGQVLAYVYAPELIGAQRELLETYKMRERHPELFRAAKRKLKYWKLTEGQINKILSSREPIERFAIRSDVNGTVMMKNLNLGDYIKRGQTLWQVADLSRLWVLLDVHESDMPWVKTGDAVTFTVPSLPGKTFEAEIDFIDPIIGGRTRVAEARLDIKNPEGDLKPNMLVSAEVGSDLGSDTPSIVVPKSAVMWTGRQSVVYVKEEKPTGVYFTMRKVILGPGLGDSYVIAEGLAEGEEIAVSGTFNIDAAAQLAGKPSMMNPEGGEMPMGHQHGGHSMQGSDQVQKVSEPIAVSDKAKEALKSVIGEYFKLKDALVNDRFEEAKTEASNLAGAIKKVSHGAFEGEGHQLWMSKSGEATKALDLMAKSADIEKARLEFIAVSDAFISLAKAFRPEQLYLQYCPMANQDKGAFWLSDSEEVLNPYFGEMMLRCGEVREVLK
ncbi:cation transporter (plasmid) [Fulvitalea axinellae]|uniref:Cation transporter n=1 Tax=Fulvitalea axinellae TaxID=1182444 RepID=A0AAU9DAK1_9BACT|nr:cation transporter [Fulvitalea axinellae]